MLIGFAIGTFVGLLMAFVLHYVPFLKASLYPLIILSQNVPTIALAPLLMIWFGFGILPKIIVITLVCFFPVAVATMDGLSRTDRAMLDYMRMIGASKADIFRKLEVPYAIPSIMSGVKIAATYSVMGAVIAEWIGADKGIGYYMMLQKASFRTDKIFVAIAIIVAISLAMFACVALWKNGLSAINRRTTGVNAAYRKGGSVMSEKSTIRDLAVPALEVRQIHKTFRDRRRKSPYCAISRYVCLPANSCR